MDYEKLYKETINKLRKLHDDWDSTQNRAAKELELVLPELHDLSETEMIENLHRLLSAEVSIGTFEKYGLTDDAVFSWLKKQGKQKPSWNEEDEIHLKNAILSAEKEWGVNSFTANWLKSIKDRVQPQPTSEWSEDDEEKLRDVIRLVEQGSPVRPIRDHYTDWLKSLKDRFQLQPKQEWSEGIKSRLDGISDFLQYKGCEDDAEFIKSIEPQLHWKPSEEQIGALDYAYCELFKRGENGEGSNCVHPLMTLIDDLKKL